MHSAFWTTISWGADAFAFLTRMTASLRVAPLRLARLASLRGRCDGRIPVTTQFDGSVETNSPVRLTCGEYCRFGRRTYVESHGAAEIRLGNHVWLNTGCVLVAYAGVSIGDHTLIGEYVSIRDANHGLASDRLIQEQSHVSAPVTIGSDVWIARGAVILSGVSIGAGAVVGANAVVTRDVPAGAIAAGVPARVVGKRD